MPRRIRKPLKTVKEVAGPERVIEKIVEVPVEVIKEVEKVVYRDRPKTNLERAIEENGKAEPKPDPEPPAEIAELLREDEAYGAAAERLAKEMAALDNKRFLKISTPADERKYETLKKAMRWFEARGAVEVI